MNRGIALALGAMVCIGSMAAVAQQPFPLRTPAAERLADTSVVISVNYGLAVPMTGNDEVAQAEALEKGRKLIYGIAATECKVLEATIASACRLERLNVQSSAQRHIRQAERMTHIQVSGNASYRIDMK